MGIIYKTTNLLNGKSYIGQTKRSFNGRVDEHIVSASKDNTNNYFYNAINKYGIKNFKWEVLSACENKDLDKLESYYIKKFDTFENGYNLTTGGEGGYKRSEKTKKLISESAKKRTGKKNSFYKKKHSEKTIEKIRNKCLEISKTKEFKENCSFWKGKKLSKEHKNNISKSIFGENNGFYGKTHSEETKNKMRERMKKLWKDPNFRQKCSESRRRKKC